MYHESFELRYLFSSKWLTLRGHGRLGAVSAYCVCRRQEDPPQLANPSQGQWPVRSSLWSVAFYSKNTEGSLNIFATGGSRILIHTSSPMFGTFSTCMKTNAFHKALRVVPLTAANFFMVIYFSLSCKSSGCCWLVGLHRANGSPHMAAASFLANLLNLMDSEKASRLRVLALPTLVFWFFFPFSAFVSSFSTSLCLLIIRTSSARSAILHALLDVSSPLWLLEVLQHSPNRPDP